MKPWKLVLGAGAACAACCAAPLVGTLAALGWGAGLFGALGALGASTQSWWAVAAGFAALATLAGGIAWRRRRGPQGSSAVVCAVQDGAGTKDPARRCCASCS